jgi:hypothetical protein
VGCDWKEIWLSTISVKRLLFGLIIMLFSFILVFAGFVLLLLDVVVRVFYTDSSVGNEVGIVLLVAVFVGVIGLAVAYVGFAWND